MPMFTIIGHWERSQRSRRKVDAVTRVRAPCLTEVEQEEEHCLEAMLPWHDPFAKLHTLRCRRHTLVDDNPASG
jgi:hypothetical protein